MEVYTRGEVLDRLKRGQKAIQIEGPNVGSYMYVSTDNSLCCNNQYVVIKFGEELRNSKWIIQNN